MLLLPVVATSLAFSLSVFFSKKHPLLSTTCSIMLRTHPSLCETLLSNISECLAVQLSAQGLLLSVVSGIQGSRRKVISYRYRGILWAVQYGIAATYEACHFFGYGVSLKKENKAGSQRPRRSCFHLQSFQTVGRAEAACCRRRFSHGYCRISPLYLAPSSEPIPWEANSKSLSTRVWGVTSLHAMNKTHYWMQPAWILIFKIFLTPLMYAVDLFESIKIQFSQPIWRSDKKLQPGRDSEMKGNHSWQNENCVFPLLPIPLRGCGILLLV